MREDNANSAKRSGWLAPAAILGLGVIAAAALRHGRKLAKVAPDLRGAQLAAMPPILSPLIPAIRFATRLMSSRIPTPPGVQRSESRLAAAFGGPGVRVLILRRAGSGGVVPGLLWLHGGGYLIGTPELDLALLARILEGVDIAIFSVDYRLAPRDRFPAALDDATAVLRWITGQGDALGIDPQNIAVGGNSAGGGLAAALAQRAYDEGVPLAFQLLMYPMLDDRTACRTKHEGRGELVWTPRNNRHGWASYLGHAPCAERTPAYAVPARREDLAGLPPAWIGVGSLDLFHAEDVDYAERLRAAGVACALDVVADAPHAFDLLNFEAATVKAFHDRMVAALSAGYEPHAGDRILSQGVAVK